MRAQVVIDTHEPQAVLSIADTLAKGGTATDAQWTKLFMSPGYRDLKEREAAMKRPFTDDEFRAFVLSITGKREELRRALTEWKRFDVAAAEQRARRYLPTGATIRATVYPLIKPKTNSFVFRTAHGMAIFLYLDPAVSGAKFENTVVHELHHIGYDSACPQPVESTTPGATAHLYLGGFGEGLAVLAAAGNATTYPHATSTAKERAIWDRDVAKVSADIPRLEAFFTSILDGRLTGPAVREGFMELISTDDIPQGAFYTVGWTMASTIERARGRAVLIDVLCDPVRMMRTYNGIATKENLPRWSDTLLSALESAR